jgi:hypothetical protein
MLLVSRDCFHDLCGSASFHAFWIPASLCSWFATSTNFVSDLLICISVPGLFLEYPFFHCWFLQYCMAFALKKDGSRLGLMMCLS